MAKIAQKIAQKIAAVRPIRPAAVLVPVVDHPEPTVLLTQRAQHLPDHPGQVSFPGGKIDAGDVSPLDSALREAEEEIGLDRAYVAPPWLSRFVPDNARLSHCAGYARVKPGFKLTLNTGEVDAAFEVPLSFLMNLDNVSAMRAIGRA